MTDQAIPKRRVPTFPVLFQAGALAATVLLALAARPWRQAASAAVAAGVVRPLGVWDFLAAFAAVSVLIVVMLRWRLGSRVFAALFMLAVFLGAASLGWALFGDVGAVVAFSAVVLIHYGYARVWSFDLILTIGLAGVALNLGQAMSAVGIAVILSVLSVYDLIAVYGTKHMVKMAQRLSDNGSPFALIVPVIPGQLRQRLSAVGGLKSGFLYLGTGDIVLPAILAVATSRAGFWAGLAVLIGALIGLTVNLVIFFLQERPRSMPALPLPAAGAILAFLAVYAII